MNLISKKIIWFIAFISIAFLLNSCSKNESKDKDNFDLNEIVPVQVTKVENKNISSKKTYAGSLEGISQADIVAKISERIVSINKNVGDFVKKGEIVIQLEKTGPTSNYLQSQANYLNAEKDLNRMKALVKEGAVAQQAVDQAQTAYDVAKANFEAAKSAVELAAPISGIITAMNVNPGDWVNPGQDLATIADIRQMILKFNVSETEVQDFKIGTPVYIYSEFNKDLGVNGKVTEINRSASIDSRSFQIKAKFTNTKDGFFKPGMFVKADAVLKTRDNVLVVPTSSIIFQNNKNIVYVIKNGLAFSKDISVGLSNQNYTEVRDGLSKGDTVVTLGMNDLSDSTKVSIINQ